VEDPADPGVARVRLARAVAVIALLVTSCSSGGSGGPSGLHSTPSSTPAHTNASDASPRPITVNVGGRTIAGECSGETRAGTPTIVLDSGQGSDRYQLTQIREAMAGRTLVCAYDRAGSGASSPATTPRPITDLVDDLHSWLAKGGVPAPYFLIGQSQGGADAVLFAVQHPKSVAGFVAMNPGAPCSLYLRTAAKVMSHEELASEVANCRGDNPEGVDLRPGDVVLRKALPASMPYAIMYGWLCNGDEFCKRVRPVESADEARLAKLGPRGRFIDVAGADHEIYATHLHAVLRTIDQVWQEAT
jgi:pimeloyl-ACP methyl ester carboxylesterase